jgi:hypothetical protein
MEPFTMMALAIGARALCKWLDSSDGQQTVASVATIATLAWQTINTWLSGNKVSVGDSGTLIKERLASGNYRVVCGVFNSSGSQRQQTVWECSNMDSELKRRLANKDKITINL